MQAGKPDPGEKNVIEHDKQIRTAQPPAEASKMTAQRSVDALREAMADHGAEWAALAAKHLKSTRKKSAEEIDRLAMANEQDSRRQRRSSRTSRMVATSRSVA